MRKRNKKLLIAGLGMFILNFELLNALSIEEAVESAINKHPLIKAENQNIQANLKNVEIAKGGYYPTIDLNLTYGKENSKTKANNEDSYTSKNFNGGYHAEIKATQNLFNGYYDSSNINMAKKELKVSEYSKNVSIDKLSFDVARTYLNIIKLKKILESEKISIEKYKEYALLAEKKSDVTGQRSELLTVNTKLLKAQSDYLKREWDLTQQKEMFLQLTNLKDVNDMKIEKLTFIKDISLTEMLNSLIINNYELNQLKTKILAKKAEENIGKSKYYPTLDLELKSYKNEDIESFETNTKNSSAMLNMKYNLFNGWKDSTNIEKIKVENLRLKREYEKKHIEQIEKIKVQHELYFTTLKRLNSLEEYVNTQHDLTNLYKEEFGIGIRTINNLVDAEQDLANARISYINAFIGMVQSTYEVAFEIGGLYTLIQNSELEEVVFPQFSQKELEKDNEIELELLMPDNKIKSNTTLDKFLNKIKNHYTISVATYLSNEKAQAFVDNTLELNEDVLIFEVEKNNITYSKIINGIYSTKEEAKNALNNLGKLKEQHKMYIRPISRYSESLAKNSFE